MEKELGRKLTRIYKENPNNVNEAIENLPDGYVVVIGEGEVEVYASIETANLGFLSAARRAELEEIGKLDLDGVYVEIVR